MVFAYTIPAVYIAMLLTGNAIPQLGLIGDFNAGQEAAVPLLAKLNILNTELGFSRYTDGSLKMFDMFCITVALMCGTAGLPHVIVRFFTVKSVKAVRRSACWTLTCIAVIYLTAPAVGAFVRTNLINTVDGKKYSVPEKDGGVPQWLKNWENRDLIAWVDKNKDGAIQYRGPKWNQPEGESDPAKGAAFGGKPSFVADKDDEAGRGKSGERLVSNKLTDNENELYYENDILVMANPEMAGLPAWVIALVMAGCVAAALSTAAGLLLVLSTKINYILKIDYIRIDSIYLMIG